MAIRQSNAAVAPEPARRDRAARWKRLRRLVGPSATFAIGAALSVVAMLVVRSRDAASARVEFEGRASHVANAVTLGLNVPLEVLHGVVALFESSDEVTRAEFRSFVRESLTRHPAIYALEWVPRIPAAERSQYEQAARAAGLTDYVFTEEAGAGRLVPAGDRPEYWPIFFMEPSNRSALGFDIGSNMARRAPSDTAAAQGKAVASARIRLVEDPPGTYAIAVFEPVYRHGAARGTPEQRRAGVQGFAVEVFRVAPVIEQAIGGPAADIDVALIDESAASHEQGLCGAQRSDPGGRATWSTTIPFADRKWTAVMTSKGSATGGHSQWWVLIGGLVLSVFAAAVAAASRAVLRLRKQVEAATELGQYKLDEKLGEGGMGVVYKAQHAMLRRPTAIKLLPPGEGGEERLARFEREVRLTSRLAHPNTIAIYDYGRTPDGVFYYAMEYLDGVSLEDLVTVDGPQSAARTVHLLKQVCGALAEAHGAGLIHRDIKPANLMVCDRGGIADFVKVLDFGLVKQLDRGAADPALSTVGTIMGTPLYLAPETIRDPDAIDARADLYAVGAVGYFLLTAHPVFEARTTVEVMSKHLTEQPTAPSRHVAEVIPTSLEALILRCLAKAPDDRPSSASTLLEELEACKDVKPWTSGDAQSWWRRRGAAVVGAAARARASHSGAPASRVTVALDLKQRAADDARVIDELGATVGATDLGATDLAATDLRATALAVRAPGSGTPASKPPTG